MIGAETQLDAEEVSWTATQQQVSSGLASLRAHVDAVQQELYERVSVIQSCSSSVHADDFASVSVMFSGKARAQPSTYDGKISFPLYRTQFDMVAELNGWLDGDKARHLATCLQGQALTVLNTLSAVD